MKKKILFVARSVENFYGAEKSMLKIMEVLKDDYDVEFLTPQDDTDLVNEIRLKGFKVHVLDFAPQKNRLYSTMKKYHKCLKYINKIISPDFIYLNRDDTVVAFGPISIILKGLNRKVKIYNQLRENITLRKIHFFFIFFIDKIVVNSDYMAKNLLPKKLQKKSIVIFPLVDNCINTGKIENFNKFLKIIYVGKISQWKGQLRFLEIMVKGIERSSFKFDFSVNFYGEAVNEINIEYNKKILKFLKENKIESKINFMGYSNNICNEYSKYDLKVFLTSPEEGTPRVLIESASAGVPYIATDLPQIEEFTQGGLGGLLVDKNNDDQVIEAINKFLNKDFYNLKVKECKKLADLRTDSNKFVKAYKEIFS